MATTPKHSIYYPVSTDQIAPIENLFATLASSIEAAVEAAKTATDQSLATHAGRQAERMATGRATRVGGLTHTQGAGLSITFPAGRFTQPPIVMLTTNRSRIGTAVHSVTTTGASLYIENWSGGAETTDIVVSWTAIQMTAGSAIG